MLLILAARRFAGLEDVSSFSEWTRFDSRSMEKYAIAYVPSVVYLAAREKDDRLVGIMDFRRRLNPYLLNYGGNIGYSVRPSERGKGYAAQMLRLVLPKCRAAGESRVLITPAKWTILLPERRFSARAVNLKTRSKPPSATGSI